MADYEEVSVALHDAVKYLAESATKSTSSHAATYAEAAKNLAEANAWLTSASQPH